MSEVMVDLIWSRSEGRVQRDSREQEEDVGADMGTDPVQTLTASVLLDFPRKTLF